MLWAVGIAAVLARYDAVVCPRTDIWSMPSSCERNPVFVEQHVVLWPLVSDSLAVVCC
jgi:hypothetical protein